MKRHAPVLAALLLMALVTFVGMQAGIIPAIIPAAVPTANKTAGASARFAITDSSENLPINGAFTSGNGGSTIGALDLKDPVNGGTGTLTWGGSASNFTWTIPGATGTLPLISGTPTGGNCAQWVTSTTIGQAAAACGSGGGSGTPLFSSVSTAGPSNTASETSLIGTVAAGGSKTIAANTFGSGTVLEARVQGFFSLPTVADSLTLKLKCGSTVLGSASTTLPAGVLSNGTFRMWLMVTAQGTGASGAFITNGLAEFSGSALTPSEVKVLNTSTVAFDFTTSCAMDMTAQWGGAQSGESISGTNAAAWIPANAAVTTVGGLTGAVPGGWVLREQHAASNSAELDFITCISASYDDYVIRLVNLVPATDGVQINLDVSTNGGSSYDTTSGHYGGSFVFVDQSSTGVAGTTSTSHYLMADGISATAANGGLTATINFYNPALSGNKNLTASVVRFNSNNSFVGSQALYGGAYTQTTAVNAFRLIMSSGNISSGTARCYGVAKQ